MDTLSHNTLTPRATQTTRSAVLGIRSARRKVDQRPIGSDLLPGQRLIEALAVAPVSGATAPSWKVSPDSGGPMIGPASLSFKSGLHCEFVYSAPTSRHSPAGTIGVIR